MKVFVVTFHTGSNDMIVNIFSSEAAAKKRAELGATNLFPNCNFSWHRRFLTCEDRDEEWSVQEWTVKE